MAIANVTHSVEVDGDTVFIEEGKRYDDAHGAVDLNPHFFSLDSEPADAPTKRGPGRPKGSTNQAPAA